MIIQDKLAQLQSFDYRLEPSQSPINSSAKLEFNAALHTAHLLLRKLKMDGNQLQRKIENAVSSMMEEVGNILKPI